MKISIIIPVFNAASTLPDTLGSILSQTYEEFEVICVDDGSVDLSREVVAEFAAKDARVRLAYNIGKGPSRARNLGARDLATGDVVAFCDADDMWVEDKLAQVVEALSDPAIDGVYGMVGFFRIMPADHSSVSTVQEAGLTVSVLMGENPVCTMSNIALRRDVFVASGGFDTDMVHNEDLEWLIRLVGGGARIKGLSKIHTWYRASPYGLSADLNAMARGREQALTTAALFGYAPSARSEAIHDRYLARRALRLGHGRLVAARYALAGLRKSPAGFFDTPRRGVMTLVGALMATVLPRPVSRALFAN